MIRLKRVSSRVQAVMVCTARAVRALLWGLIAWGGYMIWHS